jgi:LuxR family maltose regulon positive regulatory protein
MPPLKQALSLGEPEGYVRTFLDEGVPMKALLRQAASRGIAPEYVSKLLAAFDNLPFTSDDSRLDTTKESQIVNSKPVLNEGEVSEVANLVEPLSERELQVLRLLKTELSGPEIARELMIALSTMRTHTQNIYSKLDANNRRAAVNRAEELGLI